MRDSISNHLKDTYGGDKVKLVRIEHAPANPDAVLYERKSLSELDSYRELPEKLPAGGGR